MKRIFLPCLVVFVAKFSAQVGTGNVGINTITPEKTLDINGDFRTLKTDASTNTQYLLETNSTLLPGYNIAGVTSSLDGTGSLYAQTKNFSSFSTSSSQGIAALELYNLPGYTAAILSNSNGNSNSSMIANQGGFTLTAQDSSTFGSYTSFGVPNNLYLGPYFLYKDNTGTTTGEYFLPRNYGLRGQVLVTHGKPTATGNGALVNTLVWRDVADLIVLKSPAGNCFKITVSDVGALSATPDADCMVDPFNPSTYANTAKNAFGNSNTFTDPEKTIKEQKKQIEEIQKQLAEIRTQLTQKKTKDTK